MQPAKDEQIPGADARHREGQTAPEPPATHYYLFELGPSIVKEQNNFWYDRDRVNHTWVPDGEWMRRFYDAQYDVVEIDYDEETETITSTRAVPGYWSDWEERTLADSSDVVEMLDANVRRAKRP